MDKQRFLLIMGEVLEFQSLRDFLVDLVEDELFKKVLSVSSVHFIF